MANPQSSSFSARAATAPIQPFPPQPFPADALPTVLREMAEGVAQEYSVPVDVVYCTILAAASAALGKNLVTPSGPQGSTLTLCGNLYYLISVRSGTAKSLVFNEIFKPLLEYERIMIEDFTNSNKPNLEQERALHNKRKDALLQKSKKNPLNPTEQAELLNIYLRLAKIEEELTGPRLFCSNITSEALGQALSRNHEMISSVSADARGVFQVIKGEYKKGDNPDENIYTQSFSGDFCPVDRVGRDSLYLKHPIMTICWMGQPDCVQKLYLDEGFREGGFLARFLVFTQDLDVKERPDVINAIDPAIRQRYHDNLTLLCADVRLAKTEIRLPHNPQVYHLLREYYNSFVPRINGMDRDIDVYLKRFSELANRIALVLHAVKHVKEYTTPANVPGLPCYSAISEETARNAIRIMNWHILELERALESTRDATVRSNTFLLLKFLKECAQRDPYGQPAASVSEIIRKFRWKREQLDKVLQGYPHLFTVYQGMPPKRGGIPSEMVRMI
jgi:hypothetical protein